MWSGVRGEGESEPWPDFSRQLVVVAFFNCIIVRFRAPQAIGVDFARKFPLRLLGGDPAKRQSGVGVAIFDTFVGFAKKHSVNCTQANLTGLCVGWIEN